MRLSILISGRVQGVGFRYATSDVAARLRLRGWVRNTRDGRVEILADGAKADVEELAAWCEHGPSGARVTSVQTTEVPDGDELRGFDIHPTR